MPDSHRIRDAVDSTAIKTWARFVWPVALSIIGGLSVSRLGSIEGTIARNAENLAGQSLAIESLRAEMRVMNTRLDERVIREIENHERRIQALERAVKTP